MIHTMSFSETLHLQTTLPVLDNPFSQRVNAVIQKTREMRRGVYYPQLYVVKEDGEMPLKLWALSLLIQDRADVLPSYQQFVTQLKDKVCARPLSAISCIGLTFDPAAGQWCQQWLLSALAVLIWAPSSLGVDSYKYYF
jgi:hypothetical protein